MLRVLDGVRLRWLSAMKKYDSSSRGTEEEWRRIEGDCEGAGADEAGAAVGVVPERVPYVGVTTEASG